MKLALIGIGIAVIIGIIAVGSMQVNQPEPEEPAIKRAVPKEPEPPQQTSSQSSQPVSQPSTQQIQTSKPKCDPSYPDVCIAPYPPDLDCGEISFVNFRVTGSDPHGFDRDGDGIGCDTTSSQSSTSQSTQPSPAPAKSNCDPSYPTVCIPPYPPDLDCGEISYKRFKVLQPDPHGFDRDKDGIGCES